MGKVVFWIVVFFVVGLALLLFVDERAGIEAADPTAGAAAEPGHGPASR